MTAMTAAHLQLAKPLAKEALGDAQLVHQCGIGHIHRPACFLGQRVEEQLLKCCHC